MIAAGGRLGGYSSLALKRSLLAAEGLTVAPGRVVGFTKIRWPGTGTKDAESVNGSVREAEGEIITNHSAVWHVC